MQMVGTQKKLAETAIFDGCKKGGDNGPAVVVVGAATNNADGCAKKKFARCIPVPDQTCTYTFWRAERERGESEVVVSAAYAVTGRGWRQFFGNAPDLHTPLSLAGESSAQGNDEGGRADGSKPINGNPAAGKNSRAPAVFCHTVEIYS